MNFGSFSIRRFSKSELDVIFKQRLCDLFYRTAVIDTEDLSDYWFLVCPQQDTDPEEFADLFSFLQIKVTFSTFRRPIKRAFRRLILYSWARAGTDVSALPVLNKLEWQEGPFRFYIPFILSSSSSLIESPPYAPDLSILATEPSIDPETGEEIGQHRWVGWEEDLDATDDFCAFMKRVDLLLTEVGLDSEDWRFADTALNFLEKAFLRGDEEQLL